MGGRWLTGRPHALSQRELTSKKRTFALAASQARMAVRMVALRCSQRRSEGIIVPGDRIGAMEPAHVAAKVTNSRGSGIWSPMAGSGDNQCRVVNNTAKCSGPCLLSELLQDPNPRLLQPADKCELESQFSQYWAATSYTDANVGRVR